MLPTKTIPEFYSSIYSMMFLGLVLTGITSYLFISISSLKMLLTHQIFYYGMTAIAIALLLSGQLLIRKVSVPVSFGIFFAYAIIEGIIISVIFDLYKLSSIFYIFLISGALFLTLAVIGFKTKKDLSNWRTFLFTAVIAVFISSLVNLFIFRSGLIDYIISAVALIIFSGLTIYDNQFYKNLHRSTPDKERMRYVCLGALHMYINFIVIFLSLLRLFGQRK